MTFRARLGKDVRRRDGWYKDGRDEEMSGARTSGTRRSLFFTPYQS